MENWARENLPFDLHRHACTDINMNMISNDCFYHVPSWIIPSSFIYVCLFVCMYACLHVCLFVYLLVCLFSAFLVKTRPELWWYYNNASLKKKEEKRKEKKKKKKKKRSSRNVDLDCLEHKPGDAACQWQKGISNILIICYFILFCHWTEQVCAPSSRIT